MVSRAVRAHRLFTGVSRRHLACLIEDLAVPWQAGVEGRRHAARGGMRKRAAGAGARHQLVFVERLVATLIHLRHDLPHAVLGLPFGVDRSTITRAVGGIRTLLAERGCAVPNRPDLRLRTLADVFAYAEAEGIELRLDVTEIQVRRPPAGRGGRCAFVSGKKKQNTMKATVVADWRGRTSWTDALGPGRMHDATAARNEGIAVCFEHFPEVEVLLDDGCLGLSRDHRGQAATGPRKPRPGALPGRVEQWERDRHAHSSDRITVEHALADHKRWKQPMRWTHRRDRLSDTYRAIAGLLLFGATAALVVLPPLAAKRGVSSTRPQAAHRLIIADR
ncbi:transposase family protein [Streptomyces sp. NPDC056672]|uniref:transposase family protein n=1 Tax=Streptomyces sp. NPDC056672 TaxID=3345906 RepID=UPI0036C69665